MTPSGNGRLGVQIANSVGLRSHESLSLSSQPSPEKRGAHTSGFPRTGKALTLKEQSSTIDRLSKENFDLKMRIHFLSEALDRRSDEGVKEMIRENVELNSSKLKLQKDNQALRKKMKEMEATLKEKEEGKERIEEIAEEQEEEGEGEEEMGVDEEELQYLHERIET
ncbi:Anucleate primary sterigmata protein B, partial [Ascosphaera atra]